MQVSEIMHKGIISAQISDSIQKVSALMKERDIGGLPVYKNERPVGFVTDRDIVVTCVAHGKTGNEPIASAMSHDLIFVLEHQSINEVLQLMKERQVSRVLVVDKGQRPVGIVSLHDLHQNLNDTNLIADVVNGIKQ